MTKSSSHIRTFRPLSSLSTAFLASCFLLGFAACEGTDPISAIDFEEDTRDRPPELTYVSTTLSANDIVAGESSTVSCVALDQYEDPIQVALPFEFEVSDANGNLPHGVSLDGQVIHAEYAGAMQVRCIYPGSPPLKDRSPEILTVNAGEASEITTIMLIRDLVAGARTNVACSVKDAHGNPAPLATELQVSPSQGVNIVNNSLQFTKAGNYEVQCISSENELKGNIIEVVIKPAQLAVIQAYLSRERVIPEEEFIVSCIGQDNYENPVPLEGALTRPVPGLTEHNDTRTRLSGTQAGTYAIYCVPNESWIEAREIPAILEILPGLASEVELSLSPERAVYNMDSALTITPKLKDAWGNSLSDISDTTVSIKHGGSFHSSLQGGGRLFLDQEGSWTLSASLGPPSYASTERTIIVDDSAPTITFISPERGQMLSSNSNNVLLRVRAEDKTGGLVSVKLNGAERMPSGSAQNAPTTFNINENISVRHGLNTVTVKATDIQGFETSSTIGFLVAPGYTSSTQNFKEGLLVHLSKLFIDDQVHSGKINDLATLFEHVVDAFDVLQFIPAPLVTYSGFDVYLKNISYTRPKISLSPLQDAVNMTLTSSNIKVDIKAEGPVNASGSVTASQLDVALQLELSIANGNPKVKLRQSNVTLKDVRIDVHWTLNWLINLFSNSITNAIESAFLDALQDMLPSTIEGALRAFAVDEVITIPPFFPGLPSLNLRIEAKPDSLKVASPGLTLALASKVSAGKKVPWPTKGSIMRGGCFSQDNNSPDWSSSRRLSLGLSLDLLNQVLHAAWQGGLLEFPVPESMLGNALDPSLPIKDLDMSISAQLPPIVTDCNGDGLSLHLGEFIIDANFNFLNRPASATLSAYITANAELDVSPDGEISFTIDRLREEDLELHITRFESAYIEDSPEIRESLAAILREEMLPLILEEFTGTSLGNIPLPELDLGLLSDALQGQVIKFHNIDYWHAHSYVVLEGDP